MAATGFIGIDIGTHASCVAIYKNDKPDVIANENGNRTTPSVVAYLATGEVITGDEANNQMARNTANTIFDAKKILGKQFSHEEVQAEIKTLPFQVKAKGSTDSPAYAVSHDGKDKEIVPEEIIGLIISKMKEIAETGIGKKSTKAVFAVPPHFSNDQRAALNAAVQRAGMNSIRIIAEPVAVVIAFLHQEAADKKETADKKRTRNMLVFDLGGGGLNVAVVSVQHELMEIKAHTHDANLGGEGFDNELVKHFEADFKRKFRGKDLSTNARAMARLRVAAERAKKNLSTMSQSGVELDGLYDGMDFHSSITRARFEDLVYNLTKACVVPIGKCLEAAKMDKKEIHEVLMVGGGSRIPAIQNVVSQYFEGKELVKFVNPDELVAMGACIEAEILEGNVANPKTDHPHIVNAAPHSLGLELADGSMGVLIHKNSIVPARKKLTFSTSADNQSAVFLQVYEGEASVAKQNTLLGRFAITGIAPAPKGTPQIVVTFTVNSDGMLDIVAEEKGSSNSQKLTIQKQSK